jgi:polyisoprenyl-phosphate glycosyltransferase
MKTDSVEYSIVIPVYNGEKTIEELVDRIKTVFASLNKSFEILLVDDSSHDDSWKILKKLHEKDSNIKIIRLIKNYGQHNATICGFRNSKGIYVITLDDDLQHPPEEIPKLIANMNQDYNVIYGKYTPNNSTLVKNLLSKLFQKLMHKIFEIPNNIFLSSFAIYRQDTIKNMISIRSSFPFLFGLMIKSTPTNKIGNVEVDHFQREKGTSNYGLFKYFKYSLNLIINYSSWPLIFIALSGFILSILSFCFGFWILLQRLIDPNYGIMGWNSLMTAICFLGGAILMSMGIIGEYLRRILAEISYGQQYVIGEMEL